MGSMRSAIFNLSRQQNGVVQLQMIGESRSFFAMNKCYYYSSQSKSEMTEKVKESMHNSAKKTGGDLGEDSSEWSNVSEYKKEEPIMEGWDEDKAEDEMKKQFEKDQGLGGKPFDEDQRLDVNWRPIDENKS